ADQLAGAFKEAIKRADAASRASDGTGSGGTGVAATRVMTDAARQAAAPVRLLGPAECPVFRLNNFYRFHFQVQSDNSATLQDVLRTVLAVAKPPAGVEFQVDVDPYNML